jgi:hypothetical protein
MEVLQWFLLHFQQKSAHSYTLDNQSFAGSSSSMALSNPSMPLIEAPHLGHRKAGPSLAPTGVPNAVKILEDQHPGPSILKISSEDAAVPTLESQFSQAADGSGCKSQCLKIVAVRVAG